MRVLVTGAAGFIGTQVCARLTGAGCEVVGLDRRPGTAHGPGADVVADVRDRQAVDAALCGVDAVLHQAAMVGLETRADDLPDYVAHNDLGTAVLLAAMAGAKVRRLVLASSMVVYGEGAYSCPSHGRVPPATRDLTDLTAGRFDPRCRRCGTPLAPGLVDEDAPLRPRSGYAATKVAQEHLAGVWANQVGGSVIALRYHNVYGPGLPRDTPYAGVAAIFCSALARGEAPQVHEDGRQRRDFVHVTDVARANLAALERITGDHPPGLTAYNIGSGQPHTVGELAAALARAHGGPEPVLTGRFRPGDVRHITASSARANRELGYTAEVRFEAGAPGILDEKRAYSPQNHPRSRGDRGSGQRGRSE